MTPLGAFIRNRRRELGLTQTGLAQMVGVSHEMISQYELGKVKGMGALVARKLAVALEISADELLDRIPVPA